MPVLLNPNGSPIKVGNLLLSTPGLQGQAIDHLPGSTGMRAAEQTTTAFETALQNERVEPQETVEILDTQEVDVGVTGTRSTTYGEPALTVEAPDAGASWGQFLLYTDESGVTTWNFPLDVNEQIDTTRGAQTRTYVVRRYVAQPEAEAGTRGIIGSIGKKILKVLAFPLVDPIIGEVTDYFVSRWEKQKRPYRFRPFAPDNYQQADVSSLSDADWATLSGGRALLMIHGTNSRAHVAFNALPQAYVQALHNTYQGRVFAFDHFTLSEDPRQNVEWFFSHVPDGAHLDVDIICHSRGGLVARTLGEQQSAFSLGNRSLSINKVVFVAVPNAGTILSDSRYMGDFIDSYTNLLNFFPDNGVMEALEGIITVAKQLAVGALEGLDGLQSMLPGGTFLKGLNVGERGTQRYYALASNYEPQIPGLKVYAVDRLLDKIFKEQNDLVVPTTGVYTKNGSGFFPIEDCIIYKDEDGIPHTGFFGQPKVQSQIMSWLAA